MESAFGSKNTSDTVCGIGSSYEATREMIKILESVTKYLKKILKKNMIRCHYYKFYFLRFLPCSIFIETFYK